MSNLKHMYADMPRTPFVSGMGGSGAYTVELDIAPENLVQNAVWKFLRCPADTVIKRIVLITDELDGGSDLTLTVRTAADGESPVNHLVASTIGRTGGAAAAGTALPLLGNVADYDVEVIVPAAADTAQAGKAKLHIEFDRTRT